MILVVDSGSTKTEWALAKHPGDIIFLRTAGFNPYFDRQVCWREEIEEWLNRGSLSEKIEMVYYYGAGCDMEIHRKQVEKVLREILPSAEITVDDDMTGAAKALFHDEQGVALILGTGANAGLWGGKSFIQRSIPLGYLLGDHGSGAVLGFRLVKAWLDHELSWEISKAFSDQYNINIRTLKEELYLKGKPNYYLAGFSPFLMKYHSDKTIKFIIEDEFEKLFEIQIKPLLSSPDDKIRCTGSVAYYFQDILCAAARTQGMKIDKILQYPLTDLVRYHINYLKTHDNPATKT